MSKEKWLSELGTPSVEIPKCELTFVKCYKCETFDIELYTQPNGPDTVQRVMMVIPHNIKKPCPAVAVPFYCPEKMLGLNPETGEKLERFVDVPLMIQLAERGYITISADAYHLTYIHETPENEDFSFWQIAAQKLRKDNPNWTGVGKLVSDTKLIIDALCEDERVDSEKIGIAGHSLGGKMAFYTGCLDERIKVIMASDFGFGWDQTNWNDIWYWGDYVDTLKAKNMDHSDLLSVAYPKPFCLIAGQYDNADSFEMMCKAKGYSKGDERLKIINHQTGHRPPFYALSEAYDFLDKWL